MIVVHREAGEKIDRDYVLVPGNELLLGTSSWPEPLFSHFRKSS